jgi:4'-phosphopantetheinyl transferase
MLAEPIYVWPVVLGGAGAWEGLLSPDERARASRFRRARDAAEYIACRGVLRAQLGTFLSREPAALRFEYGVHEKPVLADATCAFNVSRSNGLALIAIAVSGSLGVDVEHIRDNVDVDALAAEYLAPGDRLALAGLPAGERCREFFRLWVRHEARAKASGRGLVVPAREDHSGGLTSRDLELGPDYAAALAWDGAEERVVVVHPSSAEVRP